MSTELTTFEGTPLAQWRKPEEVLAEAQKAAIALRSVLDLKPKEKKVIFNGEEYLEREDWGTVAKFYGCTAKSISTNYVEFANGVRGFEAVAVVMDNRTGTEVGRAESMCLSDEANWGDVPKYEWQDVLDENDKKIWDKNLFNGKGGYVRKKVEVSREPKPLFQLRSMAQTRAEARALKSVFGWVVVLAGYRPTPAEELHDSQFPAEEKKEPVKPPQGKSQTQQAAQQTEAFILSGIIETAKQTPVGNLWLTIKGAGLVRVTQDKIDGDMVAGANIKLRGTKMKDQHVGEFYELQALVELFVPEKKEDAENHSQDGGLFSSPVVEAMVENGTIKPASQVEGPKTIGSKRAQRIYAMCSTNKAKNSGFNEEEIKRILASLPVPLEHLSDLEIGMYSKFERWASGEEDWHVYWEE